MLNQMDVLKDIARRLGRLGIPYMLTGGIAAGMYSDPRMTRDIDVVLELSPARAKSLIEAVTPDYYVSPEAVDSALARERSFNLLHLEAAIKVDCMVRKTSAFGAQEFQRRTRMQVEGCPIWVVSKEDLIVSKLVLGKDSRSAFQARDIRKLLATPYDNAYVEEWVQALGLEPYWRECRSE